MRHLLAVSLTEPAWLLLEPGHPGREKLWTSASRQFSSPDKSDEIARVCSRVSDNNRPVGRKSSWAAELMTLLAPAGLGATDSLVMPIVHEHRLVAFLGLDRCGHRTADFSVNAQRIRSVIRSHLELARLQTENQALHWMLERSDRLVVCARQDASIVRATPAASDLLMNLQHGPRHHFTSDAPVLPKTLAQAITTQPTGQIKLSNRCTVRFEELTPPAVGFQVLFGIEFLVEISSSMPRPLSRLTAVEREVRDLICAGLTNGEIAKRRGCAFATVKNQVSSVLGKLGFSRRHQLLLPSTTLPPIQLLKPGMKGPTASIW